MEDGCKGVFVGLSLTALALLISVCLNVLLFYLRRKDRQNREVDEPLYPDYFRSHRLEEEERINQDNPIYGNILFDGGGTLATSSYMGYESMTKRSARQDETATPSDINYASLDLKAVQKRKKRKYHQKQTHQIQTHPHSLAQQSSLDLEGERDLAMPSRSSSLMVSRSSIYLNSHQVALEAEELERDRGREREQERERNQGREMDITHLYNSYDHDLSPSELIQEHGSDQ